MADAKKLHRKKHKNSRLGCPQCKERRIKCDETLPACLKCLSKPMRCGYLDYPQNELEYIHQQHLEATDVPLHLRYALPQHSHVGQLPPQGIDSQFHPMMAPVAGPISQGSIGGPMWPPLPGQQPITHQMPMDWPYYAPLQFPPPITVPYPQPSVVRKPPSNAADAAPPVVPPCLPSQKSPDDQATVSQSSSPAVSGIVPSTASARSYSNIVSSATETPDSSNNDTPKSVLQDGIYNQEASLSPEDTTTNRHRESHSPENMEWPGLLPTEGSIDHHSLKPSHVGDKLLVPLISHPSTEPQFNPRKHREYFGDTMSAAFGRVFVLKEINERFVRSQTDSGTFDLMILFGYGIMNNTQPWLQPNFLRRRGNAMKLLSEMMNNITDENAGMLMNMASCVTRTSIHLQELSLKDYMTLSWGPAVVITKGLENQEKFPKSMYSLKRYAEGLVFTSRTVFYPVYTGAVFVEFLEVIEEFGEKYIQNEDLLDDDDPLQKNYTDLVAFVSYLKDFTANEKSNKHLLMYPIEGLYGILKQWFKIYPTMAFTINSKMNGNEKVFYSFWNSLTAILESVFAGGRYLFTYLFNGFLDLMVMDVKALYAGLDEDLQVYANYSCRIIAFLMRRKQYVIRNTVLNDPIPFYTTQEDRMKSRPMEIHESFITEFRKTVIKPYHYPSEAATVSSPSASNDQNYYKGGASESADTAAMVDLFEGLEHEVTPKEADDVVDLMNVNYATGLLNNDYDPRYTDSTFEVIVNYQAVDVQFMKRYMEDRKEILQLDN